MAPETIGWSIFAVIIATLLYVDLGILHRKAHEVKMREALFWTAVWIVVALAFNVGVYFWKGGPKALEFLTAYVVEKALSVDNVFVFLVIFQYFRVPPAYQHRVLFWGVLGAIALRLLMIFAGIALLNRFHWMTYVFGLILIVTGVKLFFDRRKEKDLSKNLVIRYTRKVLPLTDRYEGAKFLVRQGSTILATPLMLTLVFVEFTDLLFAIDSIPAVLAISRDPFIVYTSNIFAILGLRALYFAIAGLMQMFYYLNVGLAAILVFIGTKMLIADTEYAIPTEVSLLVVCVFLTGAIVASLLRLRMKSQTPLPTQEQEPVAPNL